MKVFRAEINDYLVWLDFTKQVMPVFGVDLNSDNCYRESLIKNIHCHTAFCVKENDESGGKIIGGMLFSPIQKPIYQIGWLAVDKAFFA